LVREHQDAPSALSSQGRACSVQHGIAFSGVKASYRPIASAGHPLALSQLGARARYVMVIDKLVIAAELDDMAAVGVRGVRLN
jgi:hypothetical protein